MIADLLTRLESEGFEALERSAAERPRAQLLRRCSIVHSFTEPIYRALFAQGAADAPPFEELAKWSEIEVVPRKTGELRVRERETRLRTFTDPRELAELAVRTAEFLRANDQERLPERLYLLALGGSPDAKDLFTSMYDAADRADDFTRCQDILGALDESYATLSPDFRQLLDDRRTYFRARSLWSEEYYRTKMFLRRPDVTKHFTDFLASGSQHWIANVFAVGGMGKTATIRWLISRHCAPEPMRIPVGRIDFDYDDAFKMTTNPLLLLLKLARQFDEQIVGSPFVELRGQLEEMTDEDAPTPVGSVQIAGYVEEIVDRFAAGLPVGKPSAIIFDTIEVAMLNRTEVGNLLDLMARIQARVQSLRVLFAGRYSLSERLETFSQYETVTRQIEVPPFDDPDAEDYLVQQRGIEDRDVVRAVIGKSGGLPFKLSLFADVIRTTTPPMTASDVAGYEDVDIVHLIKRIIERVLNKQLHWVLRYGAIPRKLTRQFVSGVLSPLLAQAMAGKVDWDDPGHGISEEARDHVFLQNILDSPHDAIDVDALWEDLRGYASEQSWITAVDAHTMTLHTDVQHPMRRLLENQGAFRLIHGLAIQYFDALIAGDPANRVRHIRDAIYHRFQSEAPDAEEFWRTHVQSAIAAGAMDEARELASEITGSEYIESTQPLRRKKQERFIVDPALVAEAFLIDAQLLLRRARSGESPADWNNASASVSRAQVFLDTTTAAPWNAPVIAIRAAIALQSGDFGYVATALDAAASSDDVSRLRIALLTYEFATAIDDFPRASAAAMRALELAEALGFLDKNEPPEIVIDRDRHDVERTIIRAVGTVQRHAGKYDEAFHTFDNWAAMRTRDRVEWYVEAAKVLMEAGENVAAVRYLESAPEVQPHPGTTDRRALLVIGAANRRAYRLRAAAAIWNRVPFPASSERMSAASIEERAFLCAERFDVTPWRADCEGALDGWRRLNDSEALLRCAEDAARIELYRFRDAEAAQKLIEQVETRAVTMRERLRVNALRLELAMLRGTSGTFAKLSSSDLAALPPAEAVTIVAAEMQALEPGADRDGLAGILAEILDRVSPITARAALLAPLRRVRQKLSRDAAAAIQSKLPHSTDVAILGDTFDAALRDVLRTDALRICGEHRHAMRTLDKAEHVLLPDSPLACLVIDDIRCDLGVQIRRAGKVLDLLDEQYENEPALLAFAYLHMALRVPRHDRAIEYLQMAERYGKNAPVLQGWISRARAKLVPETKTKAKPPSSMGRPVEVRTTTLYAELSREPDGGALVRCGAELRKPAPAAAFGAFSRSDELISYAFAKELTGAFDLAVEKIGSYLFDKVVVGPNDGDFRFFSVEQAWQAFPWELALRSKAAARIAGHIRCFYRSRSRAIHQEPPPFELTQAIVVRPGRHTIALQARGLSSLGLEDVYKMAGLPTKVLPPEDLSKLIYELQHAGPYGTLLHIALPFSESRSGGTILVGDATTGVTSGVLGRAMASTVHPLIILDPPLPTNPTEAWRQLMLRNIVAAELASVANAHAVIAAGFTDDHGLEPASGATLDALVAWTRQHTIAPFADCVALFADLPSISIRLNTLT